MKMGNLVGKILKVSSHKNLILESKLLFLSLWKDASGKTNSPLGFYDGLAEEGSRVVLDEYYHKYVQECKRRGLPVLYSGM